jgi:hypothetical protein
MDAAPQPYPVDVVAQYPPQSNRPLAFAGILCLYPRMLLLLPHLIVLSVLGLVSYVAAWIAMFAVLFTGTYPRGMWDFVLGTTRWQTRTNAWMFGLTDRYPPFSL